MSGCSALRGTATGDAEFSMEKAPLIHVRLPDECVVLERYEGLFIALLLMQYTLFPRAINLVSHLAGFTLFGTLKPEIPPKSSLLPRNLSSE